MAGSVCRPGNRIYLTAPGLFAMPAPRSPSPTNRRHSPGARREAAEAAWFGKLAPWLLFLLTFVMCCFPLRDFDFWWHVRTGQLILERGAVPYVDWYTYLDSEQPWIDMHWGFQLLMVATFSLLGVAGVILVKAAFYTASVLIGWAATGQGLPAFRKVLIWLPAVIAITGRAYERPEMLSVLFLAVALLLTEKSRVSHNWVWAWPALILLWVNCHALYILGCVVWLAFVVEQMAARVWQHRSSGAPPAGQSTLSPGRLALVTGMIIAAALINPWTVDGLRFPWVLYRKFSVENDFYGVRVGEFQAPIRFVQQQVDRHGMTVGLIVALRNLYFTAELAVFLIGALSFIGPLRRGRLRIDRLLLFAGFSHLAWVATRNTSVFSLVAAVVACGNQCDGLLTDETRTKQLHDGSVFWNQLATLSLSLLLVLFVSGEWGHFVEPWKVFGLREAKHWFGHEAARFCGRPGMPDRAYVAHFGLAGPFIFHNGPQKKLFMDPRLEVCSRQTFEKYEQVGRMITQGIPGWEQIVNPDNTEMPVMVLDSRYSRGEINGLLATPAWRLVFADPAAAVFVETTRADALGLPPADINVMAQAQFEE